MVALIISLGVIALIVVLLIYPGELSQINSGSNRWLYDRASRNYERKWQSDAYADPDIRDRIVAHAQAGLADSGAARLLDLGCGTGRGIRIAAQSLPPGTQFTGIDFSTGMLDEFRKWLEEDGRPLSSRVHLVEQDLGEWAAARVDFGPYGGVCLMEVGEFLPAFVLLVKRIAEITTPGSTLIMTRPAGFWWLFFPGRRQSRKALSKLLMSEGFTPPEFVPWRSRYELVFSRRVGC